MEDMDWGFDPFSDPSVIKQEADAPGNDSVRGLHCDACGGVDFDNGEDGFYYCRICGAQSQDIVETGFAMEDVYAEDGGSGALYSLYHHRSGTKSESRKPVIKQEELLRSFMAAKEEKKVLSSGFDDEPSEPRDFGAGLCLDSDALTCWIRLRYLQGLQVILQLQCEALVDKFGISPMICGLAGTIWLRYIASSSVFDEDWGQKAIAGSEAYAARRGKQEKKIASDLDNMEPTNAYGQKYIYILRRILRKTIPVYSSLAISFLVCYLAREPVLPTDIIKWASEAKLPYISAYLVLDEFLGTPLNPCPLSSRFLFRPVRLIGAWQLEAVAGSIAEKIGLQLPSANFYAIASRYLKDLSLPAEKILPHACRLYEWSIPPELWLSCNFSRLPTRVCVMAIIVVTVRILYNMHGQGYWEMTLLDKGSVPQNQTLHHDGSSLSPSGKSGDITKGAKECGFANGSSEVKHEPHIGGSQFNAKELLGILQSTYDMISTAYDYSSDLKSYLRYCRDVVFAGIEPPCHEEPLIDRFWKAYEKQEDDILEDGIKNEFLGSKFKRERDEVPDTPFFDVKRQREQSDISQHIKQEILYDDDDDAVTANRHGIASDGARPDGEHTIHGSSLNTFKTAIEKMKLSMEDNGFQYLPPKSVNKSSYLHYKRKRSDGKIIWAVHIDYYILLRSCAKLAEVDMKILHLGVLKFEKRLAWIEQRIDQSLSKLPELLQQTHDK